MSRTVRRSGIVLSVFVVVAAFAAGRKATAQAVDPEGRPPVSPPAPTGNFVTAADVVASSDMLGGAIDVLVVYTPRARDAFADENMDINQEINRAIEHTNQAYANSGVSTEMRLAATQLVLYDEIGLNSAPGGTVDWDRLSNPHDGYLDNVHRLRDDSKADLVVLIVEGRDRIPVGANGYCGYGSTQNLPLSKDGAFSVIERNCIGNAVFGGVFTLAHETGHNMGLAHNHEDFHPGDARAYPYSHGFTVPAEFRTIMGTEFDPPCNCPKVKFYSTPTVLSEQGRPLGIPNFVDAARSLNETAAMVDLFRGGAFARDDTPGNRSGMAGSCGYGDWYAGDQKNACDGDWNTNCIRKTWCGTRPCAGGYCWKPPNGTPGYGDPAPDGSTCSQMEWYQDFAVCENGCNASCIRKQWCGDGLCMPDPPGYCWQCPDPPPAPPPPQTASCESQGFYHGNEFDQCVDQCGSCERKQDCGGLPCEGGYCWRCIGAPPPPNPCGNGVCDAGETYASCPADCSGPPPPPPPPPPVLDCGDMGWYYGDQYDQCVAECGSCVRKQYCGDFPCASGYCWKCQ